MSGGTATAIQPNPITQPLSSLPPAALAGPTSKPPTQANQFSQALQSLPQLPNPAENMAQQAKGFCPSCLEATELMSSKGIAEAMAALQELEQIIAEEQGFYDADPLPQEAAKKEAPVQNAAKEKPAELHKEVKAETPKQNESQKQNNNTPANTQKTPNPPAQQQVLTQPNKPQNTAEAQHTQQNNNNPKTAENAKTPQGQTQATQNASQTALNTMKSLIAQNPYTKQSLPTQNNLPRQTQVMNPGQNQVLNQSQAHPTLVPSQATSTKGLQGQALAVGPEGEALSLNGNLAGKSVPMAMPANKVLAFVVNTLNTMNTTLKVVGEKMAKVVSAIQTKVDAITAKIAEFSQKVAQVLSNVAAKISSVVNIVVAKVAAVLTVISQTIQNAGAKVVQWVSNMAQKASVFVGDMAKTMRDYLGKLLSYFNSDEDSKKKEKKNSFWEKIKQKLKRKVKKKKEEPKKETDEGELIEELAA